MRFFQLLFIIGFFFLFSCEVIPDKIPQEAEKISAGFWKHVDSNQIRFFYPDGKIFQIGEVQKGRIHGKWTFYAHSGRITIDGQYKNNLRDGEWRFYNSTGKLYLIMNYSQTPVRMDYLLLSGNKVGNENGVFKRFYPDGKLEEKGNYVGGSLQGIVEHYYINGNLSSRGSYAQDLKDGVWVHYYPDRKIKRRENWKSGQLDGALINYYSNGKIYNRSLFKNGALQGNSTEIFQANPEI